MTGEQSQLEAFDTVDMKIKKKNVVELKQLVD